jgi:hypothetical protein
VEEDLPSCPVPEYEALFQAFYSFLVEVKSMARDRALSKSKTLINKLAIHPEQPVKYSELRELMVGLEEKGEAVAALEKFLGRRGVGPLYCQQDFLRMAVDHFFTVLQVKPRLQAAGVAVRSARNSSLDEGEDPSWFKEILEEPIEAAAGQEETLAQAASFEDLELYFDRMINNHANRAVRAGYVSRCIDGAALGRCWRLATSSSFQQLASLYTQNAGRGQALLETALHQLLQQNDQGPIQSSDCVFPPKLVNKALKLTLFQMINRQICSDL